MTVTVRFAPSPTGNIHIGNARTALFNWLFAMKNGGKFILRFDDTDIHRSRQEYADGIQEDLFWLGIRADVTMRQSARFETYDAAVARLKEAGVLYACYETPEELERKRKLRLSRRLPPVYGREALLLSAEDRAKLEADGRKPHWRFLLPNFASDPHETSRTEIHWDDVVRGRQTVDLASNSDPVLVREDGSYLYTLPSVVDDIETGVTHVIRGDDHVTNTGAQIALFCALGAEPPAFGHHNLLTSSDGSGLSKRTGALSLRALRESGVEPMAIASLAALIGTSEAVTGVHSMAELAERFDIASASKSAARFDPDDLWALNRALIHAMPFDQVQQRLDGMGIVDDRAEAFWLAVRGNLERIEEAAEWWRIVTVGPDDHAAPLPEDLEFVRSAFDHLPQEPWDDMTWKIWTDRLKQETGRKGKALFMPLRLALTGREKGPEIANLLPLLGREGTMARRV